MIWHYMFLTALGALVDSVVFLFLPKAKEFKWGGIILALFAVGIVATTLTKDYGNAAFLFGVTIHIIVQLTFGKSMSKRQDVITAIVYALLGGVFYLMKVLFPQ